LEIGRIEFAVLVFCRCLVCIVRGVLGRVRQESWAYRGPERRGSDRVPPPLALEDPGRLFWQRAALFAPLVAACALVAAVVTAQGLGQVGTIHATLRLCWCLIIVGTGVAFCLRWRVSGEAPIGLLGAALVVWALPQLPFALADVAVDPDATLRRLGPLTRMTVMVPAGWLLLRCVRSPQVDSTLRPAREALGYSLAATAAAGTLNAGQALGLVAPSSPLARLLTTGMLAVLLLVFAWMFARRAQAIAPPLDYRLAVAFAGLALAMLVNVGARLASRPMFVLAESLAVVAAVLLGLIALSLLRSALDFYGVRMLSLRLQADSAEDAVRKEQERMHEVRATVAGIRQASGTLSRYAHRLDPSREHDLQEMMAAELSRLERLLTTDRQAQQPGPVMLDEVIRPLVVSEREQGAAVTWRPSGACAIGHADTVAEILTTLLTNARTHAPGAAVEIMVEERPHAVRVLVADSGPGMRTEVQDWVFERGVCRSDSPGSGLGLHIARDLARESRGELELVPSSDGGRTCFALTMPAPSDPTTDPTIGRGAEESR
jgi:signal transduction histidine kinase